MAFQIDGKFLKKIRQSEGQSLKKRFKNKNFYGYMQELRFWKNCHWYHISKRLGPQDMQIKTIQNKDWVVIDVDGTLKVFDNKQFKEYFTDKKYETL